MPSDWIAAISLALWFAVPIGVFISRHWIVARITKGVQHQFDREIEGLRAALRESEERLKSNLRDRESEIAALRSNVLAGSAIRQELMDKRRFDAVEKVWTDVIHLAQVKPLSNFMAILKFEAVAKEASDPKMQLFLKTMGGAAPDMKSLKMTATSEQLFLPELAWAYFSAYKTILFGNLMRYEILKIGLDNANEFLTDEPTKKILKAALPHRINFIDDHDAGAYHYLLEEIEGLLLGELRKILEGKDVDQLAAARAKGIMDAVKSANIQHSENAAGSISTSF